MSTTRKFYTLQVKHLYKTTADCTIITLDVPKDLHETFQFQQGQYLTFEHNHQGKNIRRTYSLCSSPFDKEWKVGVKKVPGGIFSTFVNEILQVGDTLNVMPPMGRFTINIVPSAVRQYVAFAAGSGITPILSIIKTHLNEESESSFQLFYVNKSNASIILKEELEALKNQFLHRFQIFYFLTKEHRHAELFNGRIDRKKLHLIDQHLLDVERTEDYFICGPKEMIFTIRDYLMERDVDKKKIHFELFNAGDFTPAPLLNEIVHDVQVQIIEGGKKSKFTMPSDGPSVLDAALQNNADLPYACKGGVCCTCRAKLIEGEIEMKVHYGLEDEEVEEGYILTCQSFPKTENIVVDFDVT